MGRQEMPVIRRVFFGMIYGFLIGAAVGAAFGLLLFAAGDNTSTEFWYGIGVAIACCVGMGTAAGMSMALASAGGMSPVSRASLVVCGALLGVIMLIEHHNWVPYKGFPVLLAPVLGMLAVGVLALVVGKFRKEDPATNSRTVTDGKRG